MTDLQDALAPLADRVVVDDRLDDIVGGRLTVPVGTGARPTRRLVSIAASIALVAGTLALIAVRQGVDTESPEADAPAASVVPPGFPQPLFVLPDGSREEVTDGRILAGLVSADGPISLVGVRDGDGYRDLFTITVFDRPIGRDDGGPETGADWTPIELTTGPAEILRGPGPTAAVIQQRGDFWVRVNARGDEAIRAMEAASVSDTGTLALEADDLVVLAVQPTEAAPLVTTSFRLANDIDVGTATATSPFDVGITATSAMPIAIGNRTGWQLTETAPDGTSMLMLVWMETPDRRVTVHGDASVDSLLAVARSLTVVDEATWRAHVDISP